MKKTAQYHIVNYMEELVNATLSGLLSQMPRDDRPSQKLETDIKALALNRLWPMYVTTEKGKKFVQKDVETDKIDRDVTRELRAAIELVRSQAQVQQVANVGTEGVAREAQARAAQLEAVTVAVERGREQLDTNCRRAPMRRL